VEETLLSDKAPEAGAAAPQAILAGLLAPVAVTEFFTKYFQRVPLVSPGSPERSAGLVSLECVIEAAAADSGRRRGVVLMRTLTPHAQESAGNSAMKARSSVPLAEVRDYVEQGYPIVWNGARGASAALDAMSHALSQAFGANVWPNIYLTGREGGSPFDFHFDAHEVLTIQCEGRKEWRISKMRADRPLDTPALKPHIGATLTAGRAEALEQILITTTVGPGDVIYIPRGLFHNAMSLSERSLHVTFGIAPLSGMDAVEVLVQLAISDPAFRDYLPLSFEDPAGEARRTRLAELGERLAALIQGEALRKLLDRVIAERIARSKGRDD
jgi:JmjC domain